MKKINSRSCGNLHKQFSLLHETQGALFFFASTRSIDTQCSGVWSVFKKNVEAFATLRRGYDRVPKLGFKSHIKKIWGKTKIGGPPLSPRGLMFFLFWETSKCRRKKGEKKTLIVDT